MAAVLVIARLCEPSSELHIAEDWFRRTALGDLLDIQEEKVNDDRLYRALDNILPHKQELERQLAEGNWANIREGLEVKTCMGPSGGETFILCRSESRKDKERAMRERFQQRIEDGLEQIRACCESRRQKVGVIERRVGRLMGQNSRAAGLFDAQVSDNIHLTDAEAAFRIQKDELRLRPVWHQSADRVQAHILVCFPAFALHKTLEGWSQKAGLGKSIPTLLEEFARIQSTDVVLPLSDGRTARLRCIVRPDRAQSILLDHLGLNLPERLKIQKVFAQM